MDGRSLTLEAARPLLLCAARGLLRARNSQLYGLNIVADGDAANVEMSAAAAAPNWLPQLSAFRDIWAGGHLTLQVGQLKIQISF